MNRCRILRFLARALFVIVFATTAFHYASAAELVVKPFDATSLNAIKAANSGRPFILAFWSLHCAPCKEDIPILRDFAAQHPEARVILVAADPPGQRPVVETYLARQDLKGFELWTFADEFIERVRFSVDRGWRGELPRTYLFDAAHQVTAKTGVVSPEELASWWKTSGATRK